MRFRNLITVPSLSVILWAVLTALYPCGVANAATSDTAVWQKIETGHTIIRYQAPENLKKFDDSIDYSPGEWGITRFFSREDSHAFPDKLKKKIDVLYERAMEMLDMRKRLKKVTINIYPDKKQLHAAYTRIYKTECPYRAWYTYENNTIYVNVNDLTEGMLAHEMAHSIIDHFLIIRPPEATAEILARYVDGHLFESAIASNRGSKTEGKGEEISPPRESPAHIAASRDDPVALVEGFSVAASPHIIYHAYPK
ncbi:MAG: hypothetical protein JRD89_09205 [Deltaproteobacteria bacterium]|nr:hypothetical protein [Deltaproteobacteria bacterium]